MSWMSNGSAQASRDTCVLQDWAPFASGKGKTEKITVGDDCCC